MSSDSQFIVPFLHYRKYKTEIDDPSDPLTRETDHPYIEPVDGEDPVALNPGWDMHCGDIYVNFVSATWDDIHTTEPDLFITKIPSHTEGLSEDGENLQFITITSDDIIGNYNLTVEIGTSLAL